LAEQEGSPELARPTGCGRPALVAELMDRYAIHWIVEDVLADEAREHLRTWGR
jgi:hypothetical protein